MIEVKPKGEYDSDEDIELPNVAEVNLDAEREREFKEISENATLDDIKEIADILGVAYQVTFFLWLICVVQKEWQKLYRVITNKCCVSTIIGSLLRY